MAYATFARLLNVYGSAKLVAATPEQTSQAAETYWEAKLEAASAVVDMYLCRAGFATPLDTASFAVAHQASAISWLAEVCCALAISLGSPALLQTPKGVSSAAQRYTEQLQQIASGRLRLPWLDQTEPVFASIESSELDENEVGVPPLDNSLFTVLRRAPDY